MLAATIIGSSLAFIDGTVVNLALPALQADLGADLGELQWIVESYLLLLSALMLVGGMLGDRYGRRRVFGAGIGIFAVSSVWCGLAPDTANLILARAVQGVGGALLVPGSLAILSATFAESQRGRAIGTWSGFTALATALGPVVGGWLVDAWSWRWIFFINIPPAALVLWILLRHVPESHDESRPSSLDWPGAVLATLGLGAIVFGLIEVGTVGIGDPAVVASLTVGAIGMCAFVLVERRIRAPMMPLDLFRSPVFTGANLVTLFLYAALGGGLFFFPFALIQVHGYSTTAAGASLLPFVLLLFSLSRAAGRWVDRSGPRLPLTIGPLIAGAGFALFAVPGLEGDYWSTFFPAVVVLGLGMAISVAPLTTVVMGSVDQRRAGVASGINNAISRVAGLLAIAVMGVAVAGTFNAELDTRLDTLGVSPEVCESLVDERVKLAGAAPPSHLSSELRESLERAIDDSFVAGFRVVMLLAAGLACAAALVSVVTMRGARPPDSRIPSGR